MKFWQFGMVSGPMQVQGKQFFFQLGCKKFS